MWRRSWLEISFVDRKQERFADAPEDAWRRVLAFTEHHGGH
jgi:hypothetical protein